VSVAGRASLRYKFRKALVDLSYDRYTTSGSGFFAGAKSDIGRLSLKRPLSRVWDGFADVGYAHNKPEQTLTAETVDALRVVFDSMPRRYRELVLLWFAGLGVHRMFGVTPCVRQLSVQYLKFDNSFCGAGITVCNGPRSDTSALSESTGLPDRYASTKFSGRPGKGGRNGH